MKHIAFLTLENPEGFVIYDSLCIPYFEKKNIEIQQIPWTKPYSWKNLDLVIIRSTWDYQKKWHEFIQVLKQIDQQTLLANPYSAVLWNYQKTYLQELHNNGFEIVNTLFLHHSLSIKEFELIKNRWNNQKWVIKPQISANADFTYVFQDFNEYLEIIPSFENKPYMLQPYLNTIENEGEISLFYFNGKYSHAVKKTPKLGDFRVQEEHGGIISTYQPSEDLKQKGYSICSYLNQKFGLLLYVRIDFVKQEYYWKIMEIELIEPSLYFPYHQDACSHFAEAVIEWYEKKK